MKEDIKFLGQRQVIVISYSKVSSISLTLFTFVAQALILTGQHIESSNTCTCNGIH